MTTQKQLALLKARLTRYRGADDPETLAVDRELRTVLLANAILDQGPDVLAAAIKLADVAPKVTVPAPADRAADDVVNAPTP